MLYNIVLLLGALLALPKWLFQKKYRGSVLQRLGLCLPPPTNKKQVIWIHMVSMGETKAMIETYLALRKQYPDAAFYLSSVTQTGQEEAKRSFKGADHYFFLPLDLSWIMNKLVKRLKPTLLILSESDFWYNMIRYVKAKKGKVVLLNGKISERSATRFSKFPHFTQKLFQSIDRFFVQNKEYANRFISLKIDPKKITVTGNLKQTIPLEPLSEKDKLNWRTRFGITPKDQVITLGSTHAEEEKLLLPYLKDYKVLIVPRHPERFSFVKKLLKEIGNPNFILVDQMGILSICYQLSDLAIVGGSFIPGIGGHNIFEPIQANIPVIFGPYMDTQKELVEIILKGRSGIQTPVDSIEKALKEALALKENIPALLKSSQQAHTQIEKELLGLLESASR